MQKNRSAGYLIGIGDIGVTTYMVQKFFAPSLLNVAGFWVAEYIVCTRSASEMPLLLYNSTRSIMSIAYHYKTVLGNRTESLASGSPETLNCLNRFSLSHNERNVLIYRFGLKDGYLRSRREVGKIFSETPERIGAVEASALNKIRGSLLYNYLYSRMDH